MCRHIVLAALPGHSPDAVIHSPAAIVAACPTTVMRSRCPRAFARRTQNPFSALWNVTRSTSPANTSWVDDSGRKLIGIIVSATFARTYGCGADMAMPFVGIPIEYSGCRSDAAEHTRHHDVGIRASNRALWRAPKEHPLLSHREAQRGRYETRLVGAAPTLPRAG
jgi:hypothetical protein